MIEVDSTRSFSIDGGALVIDEKCNYLVVRHSRMSLNFFNQ